ncbi:F-box protein interaction domain protein [Medicago truncatula]|uniref:F-box protein interaction domain protein n=1 Tax=Medicago truncatula TaxID=3880 RepID=G7IVE9_MEDTR|nr:F-box protein interaction domain protein [Medicago truncatula]
MWSEILCRLPVRLLLQLRCLCKFFNTLISDSKFTKKHLHMSTYRHHLILSSKDESHVMSYPLHCIFNSVTINANKLHFPFNKHYFSVVGSCDGILCLVSYRHPVILWNPSIRKFAKLPYLENPIKGGCYTTYGFGYVPLTGNYKVVTVFNHVSGNGPNKAKLKVHTLGTNNWRTIEGDFPVGGYSSLIFVSSMLNWIVSSDPFYNVVSFNLVNESHQKLLPPNFGGEDVNDVILALNMNKEYTEIVIEA